MNIKLSVARCAPTNPKFRFCVDDKLAPGSPPVGYGETIAEAIGNWCIGNIERTNFRLELDEEVSKFVEHSNATKIGIHR